MLETARRHWSARGLRSRVAWDGRPPWRTGGIYSSQGRKGQTVGYHPLDWNRDGRVGMGDGAITEMLVNELERHGGDSRNDGGGCGCGCLIAALGVMVSLLIVLSTLGGR